ncbi:MAG: hypothetical protein N3A38_12115, partial [Planctomycetota bacterium]|nr:hypothetical protein [Planctomycetota bacterium]
MISLRSRIVCAVRPVFPGAAGGGVVSPSTRRRSDAGGAVIFPEAMGQVGRAREKRPGARILLEVLKDEGVQYI